MRISICIPTYNRADHLNNCLHSIISNKSRSAIDFEVCVSDNCSTDDTEKVVRRAQVNIGIKYQKNFKDFGAPRNFLNVVAMAEGEFVWLLGDDDLLMPYALECLNDLIDQHPDADFFYVNSSFLGAEFVRSFPQPFNTSNLPENLKPFSSFSKSSEMKFMDLIDPKISFDFLGGMFLSVFRRENWNQNVNTLDESAIKDERTFSHFDNTFPHLKIWAYAFSKSNAYFNASPMSICITGYREWAPLEPLVRNIRLVEALDIYKDNGMSYGRYFRCKNFALRNYFSGVIRMAIHRDVFSFNLGLFRHYLKCALYPNVYLSAFYLLFRKLKVLKSKIFH